MDANNFDNHKAYANVLEHYSDELRLLDQRIRRLLAKQETTQSQSLPEHLKGLAFSGEQMDNLLNEGVEDNPQQEALTEEIWQMEEMICGRIEASGDQDVFLPLPYLAERFKLSGFEKQVVLICLAPELERKYEKLFAYLQDDMTCKSPTVDLVLELLCLTPEERLEARGFFMPGGALNKYILKKPDGIASGSMLSRQLKLDERIVNFLIGIGGVEDYVGRFAEVLRPDEQLEPLLIGMEIQQKLRSFVESNPSAKNSGTAGNIFYLWGTDGTGKKMQVKHLCRHLGETLLLADIRRMLEDGKPFEELLDAVIREGILSRAVLCFYNFQCFITPQHEAGEEGHMGGGGEPSKQLMEFVNCLSELPGVFFLLSETPWKQGRLFKNHPFIPIEAGFPTNSQRKELWENFSLQYDLTGEIDWGTVAGKFQFSPGQIKQALAAAQNLAAWNLSGGKVGIEEINKACYLHASHKLERRAVHIQPGYTWEDVILPPEPKEQLRNACSQVKYRHIVYGKWGFDRRLAYGKGLSMLFSGPPGTGKTMSAQVIAKELGMELYKIDLAQVVSKYIGETEKNLQWIFSQARLSSAILFFDETDALFGKRSEVKDSHDRYANIETAFLLQKMEEYEGVTVLATNFLKNIDEAFLRRISYVIDFPFPDEAHREKIWRSMFPKEAPLDNDIDFKFLAGKFEIAGGNIKNIVISAAFLAAEASENIGMKHVVRAVRHELKKAGKVLFREELGEYGFLGDT